MEKETENTMNKSTTNTLERVIDLVRTVRNDMVKDMLQEHNLYEAYQDRFKKELSNIKKEFLKRDLQSLMIAPVDLVHYAGLIKKLKEEDLQLIEAENRSLFKEEIHGLFDKYL